MAKAVWDMAVSIEAAITGHDLTAAARRMWRRPGLVPSK